MGAQPFDASSVLGLGLLLRLLNNGGSHGSWSGLGSRLDRLLLRLLLLSRFLL